jgi:hypothetical protein
LNNYVEDVKTTETAVWKAEEIRDNIAPIIIQAGDDSSSSDEWGDKATDYYHDDDGSDGNDMESKPDYCGRRPRASTPFPPSPALIQLYMEDITPLQ